MKPLNRFIDIWAFPVQSSPVIMLSIRKKILDVHINNNVMRIRASDLPYIAKLLSNGWKILSATENLITIQSFDDAIITYRVDKGYDFGHLSEIFLEKAHGTNFNNKNIIDVGMSNGDSSIYFAKEGAKHVIGIEPDNTSLLLAVKNIRASKVDDKVTILNKAVSNDDGNIKLIVYNKHPNANSIDSGNMVSIEDTKHEEVVDSLKLNDIIDMFNGEQIYLLKMDCEGCEYSVLKNLDANSYKKIDSIIMEYHNGLQFLKNILESNGFVVNVVGHNDKIDYIKAKKKTLPN